jgi:hypothetical protein
MTLTITKPTPPVSRLLASVGQLAPVLHAEWHKLRTTRSAWWTVGLAAFLSVLLGILRCSSIASAAHPVPGVDYFGASLFGLSVAQFAIAAGGVLIITAEYSGGTMPATLIATPQRGRPDRHGGRADGTEPGRPGADGRSPPGCDPVPAAASGRRPGAGLLVHWCPVPAERPGGAGRRGRRPARGRGHSPEPARRMTSARRRFLYHRSGGGAAGPRDYPFARK